MTAIITPYSTTAIGMAWEVVLYLDGGTVFLRRTTIDSGAGTGVYTHDARRAKRILAQLRAGSVYWNCCDRVSPRLPWSGVGHSGLGLTLSTYGIQTFTRPKAWHLRAP